MKKLWKSPYVRRHLGLGLAFQHRLAAGSNLGTLPLLEGLEDLPEISVQAAPPCDMRGLLSDNRVEAALLPVIDLQRTSENWTVLPAGCIACAGTALTSRVFSHDKPENIETLWVDTDARTSVALAQVLWHFAFNRRISILPFTPGQWDVAEDAQAVLMVGDKVVNAPPIGYDHQFDLGRMWFEMTGLPFTFSIWAATEDCHFEELNRVLSACRRDGQENLYEIAARSAEQLGWPDDLARRYLTSYLSYEFTEPHREGMEEFFEMCAEIGIIDNVKPIRFHQA